MASKESVSNQKTCVDLLNDHPRHIQRDWASLRRLKQQKTLDCWCPSLKTNNAVECLLMPRCLNWKRMHEIYDKQPRNYEEFISLKGVGASTVRALALISELIYGDKPSWRDPVKYSYAHGGKDGVPYPVDTKGMDSSIQIMRQGIEDASVGENEKLRVLKQLKDFFPADT